MQRKLSILVFILGLILPYYFNYLSYGHIEYGPGLTTAVITCLVFAAIIILVILSKYFKENKYEC